jgi:hypothetical protein
MIIAMERAKKEFKKAVELKQDFLETYSGLASCHLKLDKIIRFTIQRENSRFTKKGVLLIQILFCVIFVSN